MSANRMQQVPFVMPQKYTAIPDYFMDTVIPSLTGLGEVKVLLYIIRHTYGYHKTFDAISYSQFVGGIVKRDGTRLDAGAGVTERTLVRALAKLEALGHIQRITSVGAATYYRAVDRAEPPVPVAQPTENMADTRDVSQETIPQEIMHVAGEPPRPITPIIAALTQAGFSYGAARALALVVIGHGRDLGYVTRWVAEAQGRRDVSNPQGFITAMVREDADTKTPPDEGGMSEKWRPYFNRAAG